MQSQKQLVLQAQQRALSSFGVLIAHMLVAADTSMAQASRNVTGDELAALSAARSLVRYDGQALGEHMERQFAPLLARAVQTMHTDLRAGMRNVRFNEMTLLDDSIMERQIGVDRLVQRLRDADELSLGRLNVIIAQLHEVSEVRERENPFRPYLLARALFEAVSEMVRDESRLRILFDHLSTAMAAHIHDYYGAVLEVFEQRGVYGRLTARPSALTRAERERLAWQRATENALQQPHAPTPAVDDPQQAMRMRLLPKLQRMMAGAAAADTPFPDLDGFQDAEGMRDLVRGIGARGGAARAPGAGVRPERPGAQLLEALRAAQQNASAGAPQCEPLQLATRLGEQGANRVQRQRIELVALLFEFMLEDSLLDPDLRKELGRLYTPLARVVLSEPQMLEQSAHPARRLLDRIGGVAAAVGPETPGRAAVHGAVRQVIDRVVQDFDGDSTVFAKAELAFDSAMASCLRDAVDGGAGVAAGIARAIGDAEAQHLRVAAAAAALEPLLTTLQIDPRLAAFLRERWVQVLARSTSSGAEQGELIADLVWSAQQKPDAAQHSALMRMLPGLVKRVREGLGQLDLSDADAKAALDQMVAVHMEVLGNRQGPGAGSMSLDALRQHFAAFNLHAPLPGDAVAWLDPAEIQAALARHAIKADIAHGPAVVTPAAGDAALLASFKPGIGVEFFEGGAYVSARLSIAGRAGGAYLFAAPGRDTPLIHPRGALLDALRAESIRPLEYAPLFERAIDALTVSAETLAA